MVLVTLLLTKEELVPWAIGLCVGLTSIIILTLVVYAWFYQPPFDPFEDECLDYDESIGSIANIHYRHEGKENLFCVLQTNELKYCNPCLEWQRWDGHAEANIDYRMGGK